MRIEQDVAEELALANAIGSRVEEFWPSKKLISLWIFLGIPRSCQLSASALEATVIGLLNLMLLYLS